MLVSQYLLTQQQWYFNELYDRYAPKVFAKCITLLKDEVWAEDALQDIFIKVVLRLADFGERSKFSTWLYSITYNYCIDQVRKRKYDVLMPDESWERLDVQDETTDDKYLLETRIHELKVVMGELPVIDRALLLMKYQDDLSIRDIAESMNKTESAIKMQLLRAKEKFRIIHDKLFKNQ
ncbi:MAG: RNA polymerase sigma factor [Saprospiraceae bacterium]|nr:RNA polymerase sigma factor [Saprospiraceae bacterium]MCB9321554.1 RNA polymerase sigma factor [Lewinellaceae bacterium]